MDKDLKGKLKYLINKKKDLPTICKELELKDYEIIGLVELMKQDGELVDYVNGEIIKLNKPIKNNDVYEIPNNLDHIKLLLISDTHLASKYDRLDILKYLYDKASKNGTNVVLHSGDLTDGFCTSHPDQLYELKELSFDGQKDYVVDKYPKSDLKTYITAGNHDLWWNKQCGSDVCKAISKERDDLVYLGSDVADMKIGKLKIRLFHGSGGVSYAKSYKMQKYLDSIPLQERPDILQMGHIHQAFFMKQDKTHCFQTGCLEDLTPYCRSKGLAGEKSVWWINVDLDNNGNVYSIKPELEEFGKKLIKK